MKRTTQSMFNFALGIAVVLIISLITWLKTTTPTYTHNHDKCHVKEWVLDTTSNENFHANVPIFDNKIGNGFENLTKK